MTRPQIKIHKSRLPLPVKDLHDTPDDGTDEAAADNDEVYKVIDAVELNTLMESSSV